MYPVSHIKIINIAAITRVWFSILSLIMTSRHAAFLCNVNSQTTRPSHHEKNPHPSENKITQPYMRNPQPGMNDQELFFALLRVSAAQSLRAAGLTTAKPSVLDAVTGPHSPPPTPHPLASCSN